jgi:hypothetical protein
VANKEANRSSQTVRSPSIHVGDPEYGGRAAKKDKRQHASCSLNASAGMIGAF